MTCHRLQGTPLFSVPLRKDETHQLSFDIMSFYDINYEMRPNHKDVKMKNEYASYNQ